MSVGPDDEDDTDDERTIVDPAENQGEMKQQESRGTGTDERTDDDEWRFSVDDFADPDERSDSPEQENSNVAGTLESRQPLEPGDIDLENAFFVALGVFIIVGLIVGAMFGY